MRTHFIKIVQDQSKYLHVVNVVAFDISPEPSTLNADMFTVYLVLELREFNSMKLSLVVDLKLLPKVEVTRTLYITETMPSTLFQVRFALVDDNGIASTFVTVEGTVRKTQIIQKFTLFYKFNFAFYISFRTFYKL